MNKFLVFFFIAFQIFTNVYSQLNTTIKQIILVQYYGPRAPLKSYPTDPYGVAYWLRYGGLGQITPRGLLNSYNFGQNLKNYYSAFLTPTYSPQRVYAKSFDSDPSLMSTSSFLAGMFPPANSDQLWSSSVTWFPIPIHSSDDLFVEECPKYDYLVTQSLNTTDYFEFQLDYMESIRNITGYTGLQQLSFLDLSLIYDNAISKNSSNLPLEQWLLDSVQNLSNANEFILDLKYGSIDKAKLISGGLLYDIVKNMKFKMSGSSNEILIYSCEDYHLNALITLLNLNLSLTNLPFGSALVFELRQNQKGEYYLNLLFRNTTSNISVGLKPIKLNECDYLCSFGNFVDISLSRSVSNFSEACYVDKSDYNMENRTTTAKPITCHDILNYTTQGPVIVDRPPQRGLSQLELALIIVTSVLGALTLFLIITFGLYIYRNKTRKTVF